MSLESWAHEPRRLHLYVIGVYIIEIFYDYSLPML